MVSLRRSRPERRYRPADGGDRIRILFAAPAWWPAVAFGGPIPVTRELSERLAVRGHAVEVVTTALVDLHTRPAAHTRSELLDVGVTYLATPVSYRWMGITPTLPMALERMERPDVVHVLGFRDPVSTGVAAWARGVASPTSSSRSACSSHACGRWRSSARSTRRSTAASRAARQPWSSAPSARPSMRGRRPGRSRARTRGNGNPDSMPPARGVLRVELAIPDGAPIVLYVGRIASGKGVEHLLAAVRELGMHTSCSSGRTTATAPSARCARRNVILGPPDACTPSERRSAAPPPLRRGERALPALRRRELRHGCGRGGCRRHARRRLGPLRHRGFLRRGEALVVPYDAAAVTEALRRVLVDEELRRSLSAGGVAAARRMSWEHVTDLQEEIYREVAASRTASTKRSTPGP